MGSPSVTTRTTGSASGWRRRWRPASISACWRFVPCTHSGSASASWTGRHPPRGQVEADDLQRVLAEPGLHEVRQRQRGLLHRPPPALVAPWRTTGPRAARPPPRCASRSRRPRSPRPAAAARAARRSSWSSPSRPSSPRRSSPSRPAPHAVRRWRRCGPRPAAGRRRTPTPASARSARRPNPVRRSSWSPDPDAAIWSKTFFSAVSPSRRTARGVSRRPSSPEVRNPCRSSSRSSSRSARMSAAASPPSCFSKVSTSTASRDPGPPASESCCSSASRSARSAIASTAAL